MDADGLPDKTALFIQSKGLCPCRAPSLIGVLIRAQSKIGMKPCQNETNERIGPRLDIRHALLQCTQANHADWAHIVACSAAPTICPLRTHSILEQPSWLL